MINFDGWRDLKLEEFMGKEKNLFESDNSVRVVGEKNSSWEDNRRSGVFRGELYFY